MAVFFRIKLVNSLLVINFKYACFNKTIYIKKESDGLKITVGAKNLKIYKMIGNNKKLKPIILPETGTLFTIIKDSFSGDVSFLMDNCFCNLKGCKNRQTIMYFALFKNSGVHFLKETVRKHHFSADGTKFECSLNFVLKARLLSIISTILKILLTRRKTNGSKL